MNELKWRHTIQKGNTQPLWDIAEKYYDDVYRFCAFQTGSRQDAYDLTQETFLRFIRYIDSYQERNLKGYLFAIAMNTCRTHLVKSGKENARTCSFEDEYQAHLEIAAPPDQDPEHNALISNIHSCLMQALSQLPDMQREAVLLHYLQDMKYREIAKLTDTSVSTVKSRVRQGIAHLKTLLSKEDI